MSWEKILLCTHNWEVLLLKEEKEPQVEVYDAFIFLPCVVGDNTSFIRLFLFFSEKYSSRESNSGPTPWEGATHKIQIQKIFIGSCFSIMYKYVLHVVIAKNNSIIHG